MNLLDVLALVAVGFLAGAATATVRINARRPLPPPPPRRPDLFRRSFN